MKRLASFLALLPGAVMLGSCALPRNQAEVMHGDVKGGAVPLYKTGSLSEFFRAGLVIPDVGGYVRTEFDVLDIAKDGSIGPSAGGPVAQMAIPRRISSFDLSRSNCEMRAATPAGKGGKITTPPAESLLAAAKVPPAAKVAPPRVAAPKVPAPLLASATAPSPALVNDRAPIQCFTTITLADAKKPPAADISQCWLPAPGAPVVASAASPLDVPWAVNSLP